MSMRRTACALTLLVGLTGVLGTARGDTFGGFSGVDRPYLVNQDRVCSPIAVVNSTASGAPRCEKTAADVLARLSIKPPIVQSGSKAAFAAQAAGRTITISRKAGATVVAWDAPDPVVKIVELYASQYDDRVAVAFNVRRLGKEVTDVVAFDLGQSQTAIKPPDPAGDPTAIDPNAPAADPAALAPPPPADPRLTKAIADARAAPKAKQLAAWRAVLAIDTGHSEALFQAAAADAAAKRTADALAQLRALAASNRDDAIEWLIEARYAPAFTAMRSDPSFRSAVGLDRKPASIYERLMGFGGQWEQTGTSCDKPEVRFTARRDRTFQLRVKTSCEGRIYDTPFKGSWRIDGGRVVLQLPNHGKAATTADEAACGFEVAGDEDAMRCSLGRDLDFVVLPTRR